MRSEVRVQVDEREEYVFALDGLPVMGTDEARAWLDEQFVSLDCEPLRASGKVLTGDKVLVVAKAASGALLGNPDWGQSFARAASAALAKPVVVVDLAAMTISY